MELDGELGHMATRAEEIAESDEGVASVLLEGCMAEMEALKAEVEELRAGGGGGGGGGPSSSAYGHDPSSASSSAAHHMGGLQFPHTGSSSSSTEAAITASRALAEGLRASLVALEAATQASASLTRKVRSAEVEVGIAQVRCASIGWNKGREKAAWIQQSGAVGEVFTCRKMSDYNNAKSKCLHALLVPFRPQSP